MGTHINARGASLMQLKQGVDPSDLANHDAKTAEFTFFGEIGYQLIGIPVLNLVASVQGARDIVPSKIKAVFGKQYVIRTSVSRGSLQRNRISYQVDSLMLASLDAAHTSTLPSHDASMASSQHGSSPADAIEPHTIIGSSLQSMTPSTPLVLPDPKLLAMAQLDKKRKSSAIDEDLAQEGDGATIVLCHERTVATGLATAAAPLRGEPYEDQGSIFTKTVHIVEYSNLTMTKIISIRTS
uniref:Uncharacterized protein n=1 Tax=Oryza rufipogon TaxID=4529 RepID=A0A0E0RIC0_ORYRU